MMVIKKLTLSRPDISSVDWDKGASKIFDETTLLDGWWINANKSQRRFFSRFLGFLGFSNWYFYQILVWRSCIIYIYIYIYIYITWKFRFQYQISFQKDVIISNWYFYQFLVWKSCIIYILHESLGFSIKSVSKILLLRLRNHVRKGGDYLSPNTNRINYLEFSINLIT